MRQHTAIDQQTEHSRHGVAGGGHLLPLHQHSRKGGVHGRDCDHRQQEEGSLLGHHKGGEPHMQEEVHSLLLAGSRQAEGRSPAGGGSLQAAEDSHGVEHSPVGDKLVQAVGKLVQAAGRRVQAAGRQVQAAGTRVRAAGRRVQEQGHDGEGKELQAAGMVGQKHRQVRVRAADKQVLAHTQILGLLRAHTHC
jgi:hypothetical protein